MFWFTTVINQVCIYLLYTTASSHSGATGTIRKLSINKIFYTHTSLRYIYTQVYPKPKPKSKPNDISPSPLLGNPMPINTRAAAINSRSETEKHRIRMNTSELQRRSFFPCAYARPLGMAKRKEWWIGCFFSRKGLG